MTCCKQCSQRRSFSFNYRYLVLLFLFPPWPLHPLHPPPQSTSPRPRPRPCPCPCLCPVFVTNPFQSLPHTNLDTTLYFLLTTIFDFPLISFPLLLARALPPILRTFQGVWLKHSCVNTQVNDIHKCSQHRGQGCGEWGK